MKNTLIICDFDGTITKIDTLDMFMDKYAKPEWRILEDEWLAGRMGSKECIRKEFDLIENMTEEELDAFFETVELDDYFKEFYETTTAKGARVAIVSDGFDLFIDRILARYGLEKIEVYTNRLKFNNGEFIMEFPNISQKCKKASGTCKCKIVEMLKKDYEKTIYIGDGLSDCCACDKADKIYAKKRLLKYCRENNLNYAEFDTFKDVIKELNIV